MTSPSYKVYVDWDGDRGLYVGDFSLGTDGWDPVASGTTAPVLTQSTVRAYRGAASLLVTWSAGGTSQAAQPDPMGTFVVGRSYSLSAWVWIPSSGGQHVKWTVAGVSSGAASTTTNGWVQLTHTFTAAATTHTLQVQASSTPTAGAQTWIDAVRITGPGEDLTATLPGVISDVGIQFGRDQARSLQPVSPGEATFVVDNVSRDYSPENGSSPLVGLLGPGREVIIEATYNGKLYSLYNGSTDDFEVDSSAGVWTARFSAIDGLARLKNLPVSTAVFPALRTGEAVNKILDAVGWVGSRDIDVGATTLRWWWVESDDAFQELNNVVAAEGSTAFIHIGATGEFVFRDRHHRLLDTSSTTLQATYRNAPVTSPDVEHDPPFTIDFGWRDMVNQVEVSVQDREPGPVPETIWSDDDIYSLGVGQSRTFNITTDDPFWNLQPPTQGSTPFNDPDFVCLSGSVSVSFSRMSGRSTMMTVTAVTAATVLSMRLRAQKITDSGNGRKIIKQDGASITKNLGVKSFKVPVPVNAEDAVAISDQILGQYAERRSRITFAVVNGTVDQVTQQLSRDLSDRIRVVDSESGVDANFFIERIEHQIRDDGQTHETKFSAEKIPAVATNIFRFDTSGAGFDAGVFGPSGQDDPSNMFIFDMAGQGFDQGLLCN